MRRFASYYSQQTSTSNRHIWRIWVVALISMIVWFGTLDYRKLTKSDEGRYAEISREMVAGDWITPRYNGIKYFDKPPLHYWVTAAAYRVFGEREWVARLWVGLTGFAGIMLTGFTAARVFGAMAGALSAAVLASSALYVAAGHMNSLDMGVTFFLDLTLCSLLLAQRPDTTSDTRRAWMLTCWTAMALAVLSKGLIGIVLPGMALFLYVLIMRDTALLRRLHWGAGLTVFLAIALPWFIVVSIKNPEFAQFFFIHEHFTRYVAAVHEHDKPWYYFILVLFAGSMPWTPLLFPAIWLGIRKAIYRDRPSSVAITKSYAFSAPLMLTIWSVFTLIFFSASHSKLPGYILPIIPALAMLVGVLVANWLTRSARWLWVFVSLNLAIGIIGLALSPGISQLGYLHADAGDHGALRTWLQVAASLWIAGTALVLGLLRRASQVKEGEGVATTALRLRIGALIALAVGCHLAEQIALLGQDTLRYRMSSYDLSQKILPELNRDQPFYAVDLFDHTLPFYIKKTMTLVDNTDELAYGLSIEPQLWLGSREAFRVNWLAGCQPMALISRAAFEEMKLHGLPMRIVAAEPGRLAIAKPRGSQTTCALRAPTVAK